MQESMKTNVILILLFVNVFVMMSISRDVLPQKENYLPNFTIYHNLSSIYNELQLLDKKDAWMTISYKYTSKNGFPQPVIKLKTNCTQGPNKHSPVKVLISVGEHAREFFPTEYMLYFLKEFASRSSSMNESLHNIDITIIAIVNPEGRKFVEATQNYCWRGTESGVDLNRNSDWNFGGNSSSGNPKDEEYRGPAPFSEPEMKVLLELTNENSFDVFLSLHSGSRQILLPYADSISKRKRIRPQNMLEMLKIAQKISTATSYHFKYGLAYKLSDYTADGTILDFMAGGKKIPFAFAFELWGDGERPTSKCFDIFNPRNEDLQAALLKVHPMFLTFFKELTAWRAHQPLSTNYKAQKGVSYYSYQGQTMPERGIIGLVLSALLLCLCFRRKLIFYYMDFIRLGNNRIPIYGAPR